MAQKYESCKVSNFVQHKSDSIEGAFWSHEPESEFYRSGLLDFFHTTTPGKQLSPTAGRVQWDSWMRNHSCWGVCRDENINCSGAFPSDNECCNSWHSRQLRCYSVCKALRADCFDSLPGIPPRHSMFSLNK
jgi:hypothetical protein